LEDLIYVSVLKINKFWFFSENFRKNVSLAAAPRLLWQELLSFYFGSTY